MNHEALMTPKDAGEFLRVHPKTVIRFAREHLIPALRIGKHWRFRRSDLTAWTRKQVKSTSQPVE
jgi:excisionase family DNA binding protein